MSDLDEKLSIRSETPKKIALTIVKARIEALHEMLLWKQHELYKFLARKRIRKSDLRRELELTKMLIDVVIKEQQELIKDLEKVILY